MGRMWGSGSNGAREGPRRLGTLLPAAKGAGELSTLLESPAGSALDESSKPTNRGYRNTSAVVTDGPLRCPDAILPLLKEDSFLCGSSRSSVKPDGSVE